MTATRQEAIQMLEKVPEDKLSYVIQIMRGVNGLIEAPETGKPSYKIEDAIDVLLGKLDEAIDDMENGRVQTIDEAWEEIDKV